MGRDEKTAVTSVFFQNFNFFGTFGIRACIGFLCQKYLKSQKFEEKKIIYIQIFLATFFTIQ